MKTTKEKHQYIVDNHKKMSNQELAEKLGYSAGTIKTILHRRGLKRSKKKKGRKQPQVAKYDRILMIAKKHGCKRTTDLIDIYGFEKWKEICKKA